MADVEAQTRSPHAENECTRHAVLAFCAGAMSVAMYIGLFVVCCVYIGQYRIDSDRWHDYSDCRITNFTQYNATVYEILPGKTGGCGESCGVASEPCRSLVYAGQSGFCCVPCNRRQSSIAEVGAVLHYYTEYYVNTTDGVVRRLDDHAQPLTAEQIIDATARLAINTTHDACWMDDTTIVFRNPYRVPRWAYILMCFIVTAMVLLVIVAFVLCLANREVRSE